MEEVFPVLAEHNLISMANSRANRNATDPDEELQKLQREFSLQGELPFAFNSATGAAIQQVRHKLLMANAGSLNLEIDEIGNNLLGNQEAFSKFLELYDKGKIKNGLTKNTAENTRVKEINGITPTNMMLFGTPDKLLNGDKIEAEFYSMLETGYARRCLFGFTRKKIKKYQPTPAEIYDKAAAGTAAHTLDAVAHQFAQLADLKNFNRVIKVSRDVNIEWIGYRVHCEQLAEALGSHQEMKKMETQHRYWKAMKLAGAYAFVDGSPEVTMDHLYNAIAVAEESAKAFDMLLSRDGPYVKLARYVADVGREVTHVDLMEALPFYKGSTGQKQDMLNLAITWGYKNNVIIKKSFVDGIEFLRGESLKEADLSKMILSYSDHEAFNYKYEEAPFDKLHQLTQAQGMHWISHQVKGGHRTEDTAVPGFNMIVVDVDGGVSLDTAKLLLKDYKALYYTTKRHGQNGVDRFRIVLPTNYTLKLDAQDFKEFMSNVYEWLPFEVDDSTGQRSRKWLSHNGHHEYTEGKLIDVLPFIPKTRMNEQHQAKVLEQQNLNNLERWFINNTGDGNRNKQLHRYAMLLVDAGQSLDQVQTNVLALNNKLPDKLAEQELLSTILVSAAKAVQKRELNHVA